MSFHAKDTDTMQMNFSVSHSGTTLGTMNMDIHPEKSHLIFTSIPDSIVLDYTYTDSKDRDDMILTASQNGIEIAKMTAYMDEKNGKFHELSVDMTAQ
jgi:hypothetical protein